MRNATACFGNVSHATHVTCVTEPVAYWGLLQDILGYHKQGIRNPIYNIKLCYFSPVHKLCMGKMGKKRHTLHSKYFHFKTVPQSDHIV